MIPNFSLGWFDMDSMMSFKRLGSLTQDPSVVLAALSKSSNGLLQAGDKYCSHYFDCVNYRRYSVLGRKLGLGQRSDSPKP